MSWLSVVWQWYSAEVKTSTGAVTHPHADIVNPLGAFLGAAALAWAALRQAVIASKRHREQTNADRQRRITESFSKAIEQIGSDKLEVRLGGIYSLERISKESPDDYWTVMENLTAFVRERTRRTEAEQISHNLGDFEQSPPTDINAVLIVIKRRDNLSRKRELTNKWKLDINGAVLRKANFIDAHLVRADLHNSHLEGAYFANAHLEGADLRNAHLERVHLSNAHLEGARFGGTYLEGAHLSNAHLEGAYLGDAHLEKADLNFAHLERAHLSGTHLEGANLHHAHLEAAHLSNAHLEGADLHHAHLEGANLNKAVGLSETQIATASGNSVTELPQGISKPKSWPEVQKKTPWIEIAPIRERTNNRR